MTQTNEASSVPSEPAKSNHGESVTHVHGHGLHAGDHHHAFANPEELARKWNDPNRDEWQHPEQIVDALALEPGETVADLGAGTGYLVAHLSNAVGKDGTVIAIDAEPAMIEYLADHKSQLGPATVVPQKVGFSDPELAAASVHGVVTLDTWHHVAGREAYARKVFDGLKQGGRFVVVDYEVDAEVGPPQQMRLSPEQVIKQLEAAGFNAAVVPETMPRHYIVVGTKD
jgi:predicted methyltransferase